MSDNNNHKLKMGFVPPPLIGSKRKEVSLTQIPMRFCVKLIAWTLVVKWLIVLNYNHYAYNLGRYWTTKKMNRITKSKKISSPNFEFLDAYEKATKKVNYMSSGEPIAEKYYDVGDWVITINDNPEYIGTVGKIYKNYLMLKNCIQLHSDSYEHRSSTVIRTPKSIEKVTPEKIEKYISDRYGEQIASSKQEYQDCKDYGGYYNY